METEHPTPERSSGGVHESILLPGGHRRHHFCLQESVWFDDCLEEAASSERGSFVQVGLMEFHALTEEE